MEPWKKLECFVELSTLWLTLIGEKLQDPLNLVSIDKCSVAKRAKKF